MVVVVRRDSTKTQGHMPHATCHMVLVASYVLSWLRLKKGLLNLAGRNSK